MSDTIFRVLPLTPLLLALALPAMGARPLTTDDAAVAEDKSCQVESWIDRARDASTGWVVPACNFGAGIEWQMGFARTREDGESHHSEAFAQVKTLLRTPRDDSPWGVGLTMGLTRRPLAQSHRGFENPYVLVPVSFTAGDLTIHIQPGWARDRELRRDVTVWGIAGEYSATERLVVLAETFGENAARPYVRAGVRYVVVKDRFEVDLTYVTRAGGLREERYVSLGLAMFSGPILP